MAPPRSAKALKFTGHAHFRQRLVLATLAGRPVRIDGIRSDEHDPGLRVSESGAERFADVLRACAGGSYGEEKTRGLGSERVLCPPKFSVPRGAADYEASFLRLLEKLTNGGVVEISFTGTTVAYKPGVITGGKVNHDCGTSRAVGYFLEAIIPLAPFAKNPVNLTLTGITSDNVDLSVSWRRSTGRVARLDCPPRC
ncbi:MAG: RNA 3'-terminal phosphate cyclase/enolpyruvate transferase [Olpidium bornovanus]|uniref:RNA 3'-terminal phosphate cyclase/enolpyruvate transferase n=1 Tax=Olpidium bornovanus TaxID=278681 RepID=A0A8H7ZMJ3_9FUNG|nr:MAG: RNA 3'-terminal phosphate cyclase/enolpyruvate transferase [Olpidium bornovanus]